tara:strand:+ start:237 stop:371 length:135 start_codon:yes stop_codon:yes gene_type:complete
VDAPKVPKTNLKKEPIKQSLSNVGIDLDAVCCGDAYGILSIKQF